MKRRTTNRLGYVGSTIVYLTKRRVGETRGTIRVSISETSHKIVARLLVKTDGKNERSGLYEESCYIEWRRETTG